MKIAKKYLITGGAGFIGSHLCDKMLEDGNEVYCIDNLITGSKKNISHHFTNPRFHFIDHDVIKPLNDQLIRQIKGLDYVFHLASPASPPQYLKLSIETLLVNSIGTYNLLELIKESRAIFILASTSEVYGNPIVHPQKENYFGNVNPVGRRACYDEGKRFSESLTMEFYRKYHLKTRIVRIFNTFGPRMQVTDGRVISNFITQALSNKDLTVYGSGSQTRSFCYITDMVEGLIKVSRGMNLDGEVINLGNRDEKSINQIAGLIIKLSRSNSEVVKVSARIEDDPDRRQPDITKAVKLTGWQPKVTLEKGLIKTIEYFRSL
ncbi:NAD-dependent dehydratase [Candidatus Gottesmanbacteria bacterium RIFCSPLOWO2_01_FULL_39_12b]|uniref:UDP-glucuronate decarboxylase n=1 Tax=Candidatus Gottesmanbacteria bacterium RIFCSPLOWO2_01_FULL_39_12b TaxID=1798388 RepID=A0A1F6APP7_9BACT|nr:MAG: NAD-dependent dehydratase [Candidatus Gottesmanbacteria bacterium RIFCSPLOWO2_01_FULL_39_12b]